jgi:hypothetical protein
MAYYIAAHSRARWPDHEIHRREDCPRLRSAALDPRPIDESPVDARDARTDEVDRCPECFPDADERDYALGTCEVERSDGEACGEPLPCQYHDHP